MAEVVDEPRCTMGRAPTTIVACARTADCLLALELRLGIFFPCRAYARSGSPLPLRCRARRAGAVACDAEPMHWSIPSIGLVLHSAAPALPPAALHLLLRHRMPFSSDSPRRSFHMENRLAGLRAPPSSRPSRAKTSTASTLPACARTTATSSGFFVRASLPHRYDPGCLTTPASTLTLFGRPSSDLSRRWRSSSRAERPLVSRRTGMHIYATTAMRGSRFSRSSRTWGSWAFRLSSTAVPHCSSSTRRELPFKTSTFAYCSVKIVQTCGIDRSRTFQLIPGNNGSVFI